MGSYPEGIRAGPSGVAIRGEGDALVQRRQTSKQHVYVKRHGLPPQDVNLHGPEGAMRWGDTGDPPVGPDRPPHVIGYQQIGALP